MRSETIFTVTFYDDVQIHIRSAATISSFWYHSRCFAVFRISYFRYVYQCDVYQCSVTRIRRMGTKQKSLFWSPGTEPMVVVRGLKDTSFLVLSDGGEIFTVFAHSTEELSSYLCPNLPFIGSGQFP